MGQVLRTWYAMSMISQESRLICSFTSDICPTCGDDRESERLKGSVDQRLYQESEGKWIQELPHAGVRSDLSVGQCVDTKVEIQIRTIAMDFWASLEHKIYYKFEGQAPEYISRELKDVRIWYRHWMTR